MQLRHLRYFAALAREKHFARAATICHISQPTLSGAILSLERELGVRLIIRSRRFVDLTREGRLVLDSAFQLLRDEETLRRGLDKLRGGLTGALRIGVIPAAMPIVGLLLKAFCAAHPAVTVEVRSMPSKLIERDLAAFDLDAGLTYLDNEPLQEVRAAPLYLEHYVFACVASHTLASRKHVRWREAAAHRLCLLSGDMQNRRILEAVFAAHAIEVRPDVVSNSFLAILSQLRSGGWSTILPQSFEQLLHVQPDIRLIPLVEPVHVQSVGLVTTNREPAPPLARALESIALATDFSSVSPGS